MKKQLLSSVFLLAVASNALAASYTFSDADRFGSLVTVGSGPTNPPVGSPAGITLTSGGPSASVSGSFDLVNADGTSSFTLGTPYAPSVRKTYSSALGFIPGTLFTDYGVVTLFFRDPAGGSETVVFTASPDTITASDIGTQFFISPTISATLTTALNLSGAFSYTVTATSGSFILDAAYLEVGASVPDGGSTATLLGSALLVGAFLRRRYGMA